MRKKRTVPKILNLIYPPKCGICGKINAAFLCNKCRKMLEGQAILRMDSYNDKNEEKNFTEHIYAFQYEGMIRRLIINYKFNDKSYLYRTFMNFLLKDKNFFEFIKKYDTIVPVPISKKRQKERGYNQSELIAKEISVNVGLTLEKDCLFKIKNIIEQSKLNKEERLKNIQNVYELQNEERLYNKNILIVDDIYTTGSTVNECCRMLKQTKPKMIGVFTLAKD